MMRCLCCCCEKPNWKQQSQVVQVQTSLEEKQAAKCDVSRRHSYSHTNNESESASNTSLYDYISSIGTDMWTDIIIYLDCNSFVIIRQLCKYFNKITIPNIGKINKYWHRLSLILCLHEEIKTYQTSQWYLFYKEFIKMLYHNKQISIDLCHKLNITSLIVFFQVFSLLFVCSLFFSRVRNMIVTD